MDDTTTAPDAASRLPADAFRMAALEGKGEIHHEADAEVRKKPYPSADGRWVDAVVWITREQAEETAGRLDEPDSPGRPLQERPTCSWCNHTVRFEKQEESSPIGTLHSECAAEHREAHPEQW